MKKININKKRVAVLASVAFSLLLALSVFLYLWQWDSESTQAISEGNEDLNFLVAGVDDAGYHTDMMMLCNISTKSGDLKLIQIPRDTYFRTQSGGGRINRLYANYLSKYGVKNAAEVFCDELSGAMGVSIDGYVIFDTQTVRDLVDLLGGVNVTVPMEIPYYSEREGCDKVIPMGEQLLMGEEAVALVRYRKGYAEGDLGRLNAQMRFLSGICEALPKRKKLRQYIGIYQKILPNLLTNLGEKDIINLLMAYLGRDGKSAISIMRLPGEPLYVGGAWYYALHRGATERMLCEQLSLSNYRFDTKERFTSRECEALRNAYATPNTSYRVYTPKEASAIKITRR